MKNSRLVYSTESGRMCPECGQPVEKCSCKGKKGQKTAQAPPGDGVVRIRRETKGRKGKTVTAVSGVPLDDDRVSVPDQGVDTGWNQTNSILVVLDLARQSDLHMEAILYQDPAGNRRIPGH